LPCTFVTTSSTRFDFLCCAFEAPALRRVIDATITSHSKLGTSPTWVLSNHDVVRHVTRYGRVSTSFDPSAPVVLHLPAVGTDVAYRYRGRETAVTAWGWGPVVQ
jgi:Alpha amylase, catalytic domain